MILQLSARDALRSCYKRGMQLDMLFAPLRDRVSSVDWLLVGAKPVRLRLARNRRARRYILRLLHDGSARVTIPRGGTVAGARRFAHQNCGWLERQIARRAALPTRPRTWLAGTEILWRGGMVRLETRTEAGGCRVNFGDQEVRVQDGSGDLRPHLEAYLWRLAARELAARTWELAARHGFPVRRVAVRNQRSRWGSCSRRGTVSLNWRLVQTPESVRDYLICHELAHLKEMNHSARYWSVVAQLCPDFHQAERWLKQHGDLLR